MSAVLDSLFEWHVNGFNILYFVRKKEHFVAVVVVVPVPVIVVIVGMMVLPMILQQYSFFFRNKILWQRRKYKDKNDGNFSKWY